MDKNYFSKFLRSLRFFALLGVFVFLLIPFMFASVVNRGFTKFKKIIGLKSRGADEDELFFNSASADVPYAAPGEPGGPRSIHFSYQSENGSLKEISEIHPRSEESVNLVEIPNSAILPDGSMILDLKWTRTHQLISLGLVERDALKNGGRDCEELELKNAFHGREQKDYGDLLKSRNADYMHTIQGDTVDLVFSPKSRNGFSGGVQELKMRIEERDPEESFIDQIKLFKVRHRENEEVVVDNKFKNFYVLAKEKMAKALLPSKVWVLDKETDAKNIFGNSFLGEAKGIRLNYGQRASVSFNGLDSSKSYFLLARARERGWSPRAQTVFHVLPQPARLAFLAGAAFLFTKFFGKFAATFPLFALLGNGSTPYLAVWDGKNYVLDNDVLFSSVFNYSDNLALVKSRYEKGEFGPDLYKIKGLKSGLPDGLVETYLFSASGFYTDIRVQNQEPYRNILWLSRLAEKAGV